MTCSTKHRRKQAALTSLNKSSAPHRAQILGEVLPRLHPRILDLALDELAFHKDPESIVGLEIVLSSDAQAPLGTLRKALGVLGAIPSPRAVEIVGKIMLDARRDASLRKAAEAILKHHPYAVARDLLAQAAKHAAESVLAAEL